MCRRRPGTTLKSITETADDPNGATTMHPTLTHSLTRAILDDRAREARHGWLLAMPHVDEPGSGGFTARLATARRALGRPTRISTATTQLEPHARGR